jgi:hypothetical protein
VAYSEELCLIIIQNDQNDFAEFVMDDGFVLSLYSLAMISILYIYAYK